jgi:hypothetical protein
VAERFEPATDGQLETARLSQEARIALDHLLPHLERRTRKALQEARQAVEKRQLDPTQALRICLQLAEIESLRADLVGRVRKADKSARG